MTHIILVVSCVFPCLGLSLVGQEATLYCFKEQIKLRGTTVVQVRIFWPTEAAEKVCQIREPLQYTNFKKNFYFHSSASLLAVVEQPIVVPEAVTVVLNKKIRKLKSN